MHRTTQRFEIEIYRKPTSIVPVIHSTSYQPKEHKTAACRFSLPRIDPLPLIHRNKQKEQNTIIHIVKTNEFPLPLLMKIDTKILHKNITYVQHSQ
jgi:hypothetical protein